MLAAVAKAGHDHPELVTAPLAATPVTFLHGDWKMGNLGTHPNGQTILLDWAYPGSGPACWDLCWYLALNSARLPESKEATIDRFRAALVAHGIDLLPPDMENVEALDRIIYDELVVGKVTRDAERALRTMITVKEQEGAEAIVLACTELELVVDVDANVLPIYDSTRIHAEKAAEWILGQD